MKILGLILLFIPFLCMFIVGYKLIGLRDIIIAFIIWIIVLAMISTGAILITS